MSERKIVPLFGYALLRFPFSQQFFFSRATRLLCSLASQCAEEQSSATILFISFPGMNFRVRYCGHFPSFFHQQRAKKEHEHCCIGLWFKIVKSLPRMAALNGIHTANINKTKHNTTGIKPTDFPNIFFSFSVRINWDNYCLIAVSEKNTTDCV